MAEMLAGAVQVAAALAMVPEGVERQMGELRMEGVLVETAQVQELSEEHK